MWNMHYALRCNLAKISLFLVKICIMHSGASSSNSMQVRNFLFSCENRTKRATQNSYICLSTLTSSRSPLRDSVKLYDSHFKFKNPKTETSSTGSLFLLPFCIVSAASEILQKLHLERDSYYSSFWKPTTIFFMIQ